MIHHDQCFHSCRRTEAIPKGSDPNVVEVIVFDRLGPIYTKRQQQLCNNCRDYVLIETMESLQNGVATHFEATTLFSIRPVLLVSLQHCRSIDTDAECKRALTMQVILAHCQI